MVGEFGHTASGAVGILHTLGRVRGAFLLGVIPGVFRRGPLALIGRTGLLRVDAALLGCDTGFLSVDTSGLGSGSFALGIDPSLIFGQNNGLKKRI
jgi:hypothetical protein